MLSKEVSSTIIKVFGMTRPGIEPRSPTQKKKKKIKTSHFVNVAVPTHYGVKINKCMKIKKYLDIARERKRERKREKTGARG